MLKKKKKRDERGRFMLKKKKERDERERARKEDREV
jgi:hypothetical protein